LTASDDRANDRYNLTQPLDALTVVEPAVTEETSDDERLVDHAAVPNALSFDGAARLTVSVPAGTEVRELVGLLQSACEGAELVARRDRERAIRTRATFGSELEAQLTPRQLEVLKTAYLSGFFDSPRQLTGEQVASSLDISQPTFSNHLRAGLRKLLDMLFITDLGDPRE
jgi:predicted DNA binding protein